MFPLGIEVLRYLAICFCGVAVFADFFFAAVIAVFRTPQCPPPTCLKLTRPEILPYRLLKAVITYRSLKKPPASINLTAVPHIHDFPLLNTFAWVCIFFTDITLQIHWGHLSTKTLS